jgi:glutaredoxin
MSFSSNSAQTKKRHAQFALHNTITIIIYGKSSCFYTKGAIHLVEKMIKKEPGVVYKYYDISKIPNYRKKILEQHRHKTVPAIFSQMTSKLHNKRESRFIGSYDGFLAMMTSGKKNNMGTKILT